MRYLNASIGRNVLAFALVIGLSAGTASAATAKEMQSQARAALSSLVKTSPAAAALSKTAKAILVFPKITKGGLGIGGQYGEGVVFQKGKTAGYFKTTGASYGMQAGVQQFSYALFFMSEGDLAYLRRTEGWEVGVGPSVVIVDSGVARSITTTTAREGVYAFFFGQKGLMGGFGVQGTKITEIHPE